jgi:hypothetical protein
MMNEHPNAAGHRPPTHKALSDLRGDDVPAEIVASSLHEVTSVLSQATDQLTKTTEALWRTKTLSSAEAKARGLLVRSQAAADECISSAEEEGRQIVIDARGKASRVVDEARTRAAAIIEAAERSTFPAPDAVAQLSAAIEGVRSMSDVLAQDLALLSESLAQMAEPAPVPGTSPAPVMAPEPADPPVMTPTVEPAPEPLPAMTTREPDAPVVAAPMVEPQAMPTPRAVAGPMDSEGRGVAAEWAASPWAATPEITAAAVAPQAEPLAAPEPVRAGATTPPIGSYWDRTRARRVPMPLPDPVREEHPRRRKRRLARS